MKNLGKILSLIPVLAVMVCALTLMTASANEAAAPEIRQNLYYDENIKMMYAVPEGSTALQYRYNRFVLNDNPENANDGKWEWTEWTDAEKYATQNIDNDGNMYDVYMAAGVPAQKLDTIFEVRFVGDEKAVKTYSGLEYLYERLYIDKDEITDDQKNMYESLLTYAGYAQTLLVKYDYTALGSYAYVTTENADQATGIYAGEVTLTPSITKGSNEIIVATVNSSPIELANDDSYKLTLEGGKHYEVEFATVADDVVITPPVVITADKLISSHSSSYVDSGSGEIGGATISFSQLANNGDGLQMRYNSGNSSQIWNSSAFAKPIKEIIFTWNTAKTGRTAANAVNIAFGNTAECANYTYQLSTTAGTSIYTITPNSETYNYFHVAHNYSGNTFYWDSITVVFSDKQKCATCSYSEYTYNNDAACGVDGTETAICGVCGSSDTRTASGSALEHILGNYINEGDVGHCQECEREGCEYETVPESHSSESSCEKCDYTSDSGSGESATEHTVTFIAKDQGYVNAQEVSSITFNSDISAVLSKGSNSNTPKYYDTGKGIRLYGSNTITFTPESGCKIKSIVFTTASGYSIIASSAADNGSLSDTGTTTVTLTPTDGKAAVSLTQGGSSGHARISQIVITYTK